MKNTSRSPEIQALVDEFKLENNTICLSQEALQRWDGRFTKWPRAQREKDATELLTVARWWHREVGDAAKKAIDQLVDLASTLLAGLSAGKTRDGFGLTADGTNRAKMLGAARREFNLGPAPASSTKAFKFIPPMPARA